MTKPLMTVTLKTEYSEYLSNVDSIPMNKTITHVCSGESMKLYDLLGEFEDFLKASGFVFSGHLTIADE